MTSKLHLPISVYQYNFNLYPELYSDAFILYYFYNMSTHLTNWGDAYIYNMRIQAYRYVIERERDNTRGIK